MPYPAGDAAREEIDFFDYDDDGESGEESNESGFVQEDLDEGGALAMSILQDEHASVNELQEIQFLFAYDSHFTDKGKQTGIKWQSDFELYRCKITLMESEQQNSLFCFYNEIVFPGISLGINETVQTQGDGSQPDEDDFDSELHALDQRNAENPTDVNLSIPEATIPAAENFLQTVPTASSANGSEQALEAPALQSTGQKAKRTRKPNSAHTVESANTHKASGGGCAKRSG
ncbi:hypothetical protein WOLCODRAFT_158014 [Wolfiporia cocos MD-104 SS10]|uniref:Uncharacterized protein n=1 Tax=Wolfiporia cocos (strain MD-104) TaxID=742152 RepID=A0A2H3JKX1_WOLCO|nr:hypothetical protein WOLCODRAFT_158014 [Wolfiporia cocos MD-104 SS10]